METENLNTLYWIVPLLTAALGMAIGYVLGRKAREARQAGEAGAFSESFARLQADLDACRDQLATANSEAVRPDIPFDYQAAKADFGVTVHQDDLKIIEGIGPKIESLFHNYDIKTWRALAGTPVAKCQEVLDSGGDRYKIHDPSSWPMQARMAYENKWKELRRWQDEHLHGKL